MVFYSKKHCAAEANYEIYNKGPMRIVRVFKEWRAELEPVESPIQVLSDNTNLEYIISIKNLSRRQERWAKYISHFNLQIAYQPGKKNIKPEALTGLLEDLPKEGDESYQNVLTVIKRIALCVYWRTVRLVKGGNHLRHFGRKALTLTADKPRYWRSSGKRPDSAKWYRYPIAQNETGDYSTKTGL